LREEDKRSLALVVAGALFGFIAVALNLPVDVEIFLVTLLLIIIVFLLLYGVGVPQTKFHEFVLKRRWKKPLKIGILNDMKWDLNNKEIFAWSDVSPDEWKNVIGKLAEEQKVSVKVDLIDVHKKFDSYAAILNPYGGVYPELDLNNLSTLEKIVNYVREGALFINVADIPSYWAYNQDLHRKLDIASTVYGVSTTTAGLQIIATKPFDLGPLMKKLGLRVLGIKPKDIQLTATTKTLPIIKSERIAIVESNVTSCIPTWKQLYNDGNTYDFSALFFVKLGEGEFLFSLIWINARYHNQQAKEAIRDAICNLAMEKLISKT
jgi:hypothetical protein